MQLALRLMGSISIRGTKRYPVFLPHTPYGPPHRSNGMFIDAGKRRANSLALDMQEGMCFDYGV